MLRWISLLNPQIPAPVSAAVAGKARHMQAAGVYITLLLMMMMMFIMTLLHHAICLCPLFCQVYHVFELEIELPKYAMYAAEERALSAGPPASHISFVMQHPASRIASWVESRFSTKPNLGNGANSLEAAFTCMRSRQPLVVRAAAGSSRLRVALHCESMELAGELLQVRKGQGLQVQP